MYGSLVRSNKVKEIAQESGGFVMIILLFYFFLLLARNVSLKVTLRIKLLLDHFITNESFILHYFLMFLLHLNILFLKVDNVTFHK